MERSLSREDDTDPKRIIVARLAVLLAKSIFSMLLGGGSVEGRTRDYGKKGILHAHGGGSGP